MNAIDVFAERLRPHYSRFLAGAGGDVLMTGHSHQAWPDVSRDAQLEAWDHAASRADGKWDRVFGELVPAFQRGVAARIGSTRSGDIAIASNTHELVFRLLSSFRPWPSVLTTGSEFHSLARQLARIEEEGARVTRVAPERIAAEIDRIRPDLVAFSYVLFTTSRVVIDLPAILEAAAARGIPVLVDAYHAFNTLELDADRWPGTVFVTGGGYKYAQHGEGACWMLLPADATRFRPTYTGWFADFEHLEGGSSGVAYAPGGARFFGATFDPTALFRAVRVMTWMDEMGLTPAALRAQSILQTQLLIDHIDAVGGLDVATPRPEEERGAFVAITHPDAQALARTLAARGIRTDARTPYLRLGPAPYTTTTEIARAAQAL